MYRRLSVPDYIIYGLLGIGIISGVVRNPAAFVIPILVFGTIFLLYKFPPNRIRFRNGAPTAKRYSGSRHSDRTKRKNSFRVIYGNKPNSEDEPPRYH
jgi:hypothetical protein